MDPADAADLISALTDWFRSLEVQRSSGLADRKRASEVAEIVALQRLQSTGSLDTAFKEGMLAFGREIRRSGPLSFTRDTGELDRFNKTRGPARV